VKQIYALGLFLLVSNSAFSQFIGDSLSLEWNVVLNKNQLPFGLRSNNGGLFDNSMLTYTNRLTYFANINTSKFLKTSIFADAVARLSHRSSFHFRELYIRTDFWFFKIEAGRFFDTYGLSEDLFRLSSMGSVMVSRNATPFPKISLKTNSWIPVPLTFGFFNWRASLDHGILNDNRYVKNTYVHQKSFYLNLDLWIFQGYGGLIHNAQWGGTHPVLGKLPQSFDDYLAVVTGIVKNKNSSGLEDDVNNVVGNSIAAYDFGLTFHIKPVKLSAYRIFYHEDTVSLRFRNAWDGMWGGMISFDRPIFMITKFGHEYLNMIRLGKRRGINPPEPDGVDNPYNHWIYLSGWTYNNAIIGTPLFLVNQRNNRHYFFENNEQVVNNIVVAHHSFIEGSLNTWKFNMHLIQSQNFGTYRDMEKLGEPYYLSKIKKNQYYAYSKVSKKNILTKKSLPIELSTTISLDFGELYQTSYAILFGFKLLDIVSLLR